MSIKAGLQMTAELIEGLEKFDWVEDTTCRAGHFLLGPSAQLWGVHWLVTKCGLRCKHGDVMNDRHG